METALLLLPDMQSLGLGLRSVFGVSNAAELTILDRERNAYASGSPSEIVTCRFADGRVLRLLFKYARYPDATRNCDLTDEHFIVQSWSNVPYEAAVYRQALEPLRLSTPKFYGTYLEPGSGRVWLVLEYFDNAIPLDELLDGSQMDIASNWLGRFHAAGEHLVANPSVYFLKRLDAGHYSALVKRSRSHAGKLDHWFSWLPDLCTRFEDFVASTWTPRPTVTHGDYYRHNILLREGNIHPVDWEQAAIDLGEMDLACLTHRWPAKITQRCELEYQRSRWPQGSPDDFKTALNAARLVLYLDEIRNLPNWTEHNERLTFGQEMRSLGECLGLM
jgi:hypothetical protein